MKKFLLSCAAVALGFGFASAETLTLDFVSNTYEMVRMSGTVSTYAPAGVLVNENGVVLNNVSTSAPTGGVRLWSDGLRFYKDGVVDIEVAGGTISSVTMTGTFTNMTIGDNAASDGWSGSAEIVQVKYIGASKNSPIKTMTIEYTPASSDLQAANLSFPEAEYRVKFPNGEFTAPVLTKDTDAVAVYTSSDEAVATVAADGAVTIIKPGTTTITAKCAANDKFTGGSAKYTLVVYAAASSLEDLTELAALDAKGTFRIDCPLTVTYINGLNMYVVDAKGDATLIYGTKFEFNPGDVLSTGWMVIYSPYNNLPEYKISGDAPTVVSNGAVFEIPEVKLADVNDTMLNKLINLVNVPIKDEIPQSKTSVVVTDGDASLTFYNTFEVPPFTPEEGKSYRVKGIVSIYKETIQFAPIEYSIESGVAPIEANEGIATYFDLNGRQVKGQLANGIYVKVANGKATKVVVK